MSQLKLTPSPIHGPDRGRQGEGEPIGREIGPRQELRVKAKNAKHAPAMLVTTPAQGRIAGHPEIAPEPVQAVRCVSRHRVHGPLVLAASHRPGSGMTTTMA